MALFRDFLLIVILVGIVTRLLTYLFKKKMREKDAIAFSFIITLLIGGPIAILLLGFDVAIAEFTISLIAWYVYDLLRIQLRR